MEIDFSIRRVEANQSAAREHETPAPAVDGCQHGRGVARQLVGELVTDFSSRFVEGNHTAAIAFDVSESRLRSRGLTTAHVYDQHVVFDDGNAGNAEEVLQDTELRAGIHLPNHFSIAASDAMQHSFDAV